MIVLGIDPGTATTGYGVIKREAKKRYSKCLEYGVIKTTPNLTAPEKLKIINNELSKIIKRHQPRIMAVETLYFFKNLKTAMPVSQARGVILLTAAKNKIPVYELTPLQAKLIVTGFGRAEKKVVQENIKSFLRLEEIPKPDDAADALAIALAYIIKEG